MTTKEQFVFITESIRLAIMDFNRLEKSNSLYGMTQDLIILQKSALQTALIKLEIEETKS